MRNVYFSLMSPCAIGHYKGHIALLQGTYRVEQLYYIECTLVFENYFLNRSLWVHKDLKSSRAALFENLWLRTL